MYEREHEEWLENQNARKAAAKAKVKRPPVLKKKAEDKKKEADDDDLNGRVWRGEAA